MTSPAVALPRVPEKTEQSAIVNLLENIGATVYKLGGARRRGDFPGTMQTPGLPDLFVFMPAKGLASTTALWIEVKAVGGRVRPEQAAFEGYCESADVCYVRGTCDDVIRWLRRAGWLK